MAEFWTPPPIFHGRTAVVIGGGPSLTKEDVEHCRGRAGVVAVNDAYKLAPWADVLYACDRKWWGWHDGVPDFQGYKVSLEKADYPEVRQMENSGADGFDKDKTKLRTISNGGGQAIQVAVKMGAKKVVLLGFDMKPASSGKLHWFGDHPVGTKPSVFAQAMLPKFPSLKAALDEMGVEVVNASRETALTIWPMMLIEEALRDARG